MLPFSSIPLFYIHISPRYQILQNAFRTCTFLKCFTKTLQCFYVFCPSGFHSTSHIPEDSLEGDNDSWFSTGGTAKFGARLRTSYFLSEDMIVYGVTQRISTVPVPLVINRISYQLACSLQWRHHSIRWHRSYVLNFKMACVPSNWDATWPRRFSNRNVLVQLLKTSITGIEWFRMPVSCQLSTLRFFFKFH